MFNSFLIIFAFLTGGFVIATFSQALLQFEFGKVFGAAAWNANSPGFPTITSSAVREEWGVLSRASCAPVDNTWRSSRKIHSAQWAVDEQIPVVVGNASSEDNLKRAHIESAKGFVAVVGSDAENLYIVLRARGFRSDLKIIARASEEEATSKLLRAGASQVLSPYFFVGRRIAQLLLRPNVLDFIDAAFGTERLDVEIGEVRIQDSSPLLGRSLGDSDFRQQAGVIVLGIKPAVGALLFNPAPETLIRADDCLIVIGSDTHLKKLESLAHTNALAPHSP